MTPQETEESKMFHWVDQLAIALAFIYVGWFGASVIFRPSWSILMLLGNLYAELGNPQLSTYVALVAQIAAIVWGMRKIAYSISPAARLIYVAATFVFCAAGVTLPFIWVGISEQFIPWFIESASP